MSARIEALLFGSLARGIELLLSVLHGVAYPVQRAPASLLHDGPVIFVANHCSLLDTPFLRWSFPRGIKRKLVTVGGFDFFEPHSRGVRRTLESLFLRFVVHGYRVWMIDRRLDGAAHLGALSNLLEQRWTLLLYPEGRRSRTGDMGPMQPGAAILSRRTGAPIVPIHIAGSAAILPPGRFWPRCGRPRVRVGTPMRPRDGEHPEAFMLRVRDAILALSGARGTHMSGTERKGRS